jgi:uncharacterized protein (TIGR03083 family)
MDFATLTEHLTSDYSLLHAAVAASDPAAPVSSCPGWTVDDLAGHVAEVYLHKAECIRLRAFPRPWPPPRQGGPPTTALDTAWARLMEQLATHDPADPAATWHDPDQTVGFWIRRMAHETVIHRVDAQLAAGIPVDAIPGDLALDDVDEVLTLFIGYGSTAWSEEFAPVLEGADPRPVRITATAGGHARSWVVTVNPDGVRVAETPSGAAADPPPAAEASGDADTMARWLWGRAESGAVATSGDRALLDQLRRALLTGTQ